MSARAHMTEPQRVYLDFVRATAAFCVLFGHAAVSFLAGSSLEQANIQIGAVPVFFLISGFLISFSVFQKHADPHYGFSQYFIDRFCRIYSAYIPALIFVAGVDATITHLNSGDWIDRFTAETWIGNLFMLQDFPLFQVARRLHVPDNVWFIRPFGTGWPFWTISIEWWIYMLFGMTAYVWLKAKRPFTLWQKLLFVFVAIEPVYHFVGGPDRCLTMLWVIGMGASFLYFRLPVLLRRDPLGDRRWRRTCFAIFAAAVFALVAHNVANGFHEQAQDVYGHVNGGMTEFQSGVYLAVALFALFFAFGTFGSVPKLLARPIGFVAEYSYSLYLTHSTVIAYIAAHYPDDTHDPQLFWIAIAISNILAITFWGLFERYHRKLANWLKAFVARAEPQLTVPEGAFPHYASPAGSALHNRGATPRDSMQ